MPPARRRSPHKSPVSGGGVRQYPPNIPLRRIAAPKSARGRMTAGGSRRPPGSSQLVQPNTNPFSSLDPNAVNSEVGQQQNSAPTFNFDQSTTNQQPQANGSFFGQPQSQSFPQTNSNSVLSTQNSGSNSFGGFGSGSSSSFNFNLSSTNTGFQFPQPQTNGHTGSVFGSNGTRSQPSSGGFSGFQGGFFNLPAVSDASNITSTSASTGLFGAPTVAAPPPSNPFAAPSLTPSPSLNPFTSLPQSQQELPKPSPSLFSAPTAPPGFNSIFGTKPSTGAVSSQQPQASSAEPTTTDPPVATQAQETPKPYSALFGTSATASSPSINFFGIKPTTEAAPYPQPAASTEEADTTETSAASKPQETAKPFSTLFGAPITAATPSTNSLTASKLDLTPAIKRSDPLTASQPKDTPKPFSNLFGAPSTTDATPNNLFGFPKQDLTPAIKPSAPLTASQPKDIPKPSSNLFGTPSTTPAPPNNLFGFPKQDHTSASKASAPSGPPQSEESQSRDARKPSPTVFGTQTAQSTIPNLFGIAPTPPVEASSPEPKASNAEPSTPTGDKKSTHDKMEDGDVMQKYVNHPALKYPISAPNPLLDSSRPINPLFDPNRVKRAETPTQDTPSQSTQAASLSSVKSSIAIAKPSPPSKREKTAEEKAIALDATIREYKRAVRRIRLDTAFKRKLETVEPLDGDLDAVFALYYAKRIEMGDPVNLKVPRLTPAPGTKRKAPDDPPPDGDRDNGKRQRINESTPLQAAQRNLLPASAFTANSTAMGPSNGSSASQAGQQTQLPASSVLVNSTTAAASEEPRASKGAQRNRFSASIFSSKSAATLVSNDSIGSQAAQQKQVPTFNFTAYSSAAVPSEKTTATIPEDVDPDFGGKKKRKMQESEAHRDLNSAERSSKRTRNAPSEVASFFKGVLENSGTRGHGAINGTSHPEEGDSSNDDSLFVGQRTGNRLSAALNSGASTPSSVRSVLDEPRSNTLQLPQGLNPFANLSDNESKTSKAGMADDEEEEESDDSYQTDEGESDESDEGGEEENQGSYQDDEGGNQGSHQDHEGESQGFYDDKSRSNGSSASPDSHRFNPHDFESNGSGVVRNHPRYSLNDFAPGEGPGEYDNEDQEAHVPEEDSPFSKPKDRRNAPAVRVTNPGDPDWQMRDATNHHRVPPPLAPLNVSGPASDQASHETSSMQDSPPDELPRGPTPFGFLGFNNPSSSLNSYHGSPSNVFGSQPSSLNPTPPQLTGPSSPDTAMSDDDDSPQEDHSRDPEPNTESNIFEAYDVKAYHMHPVKVKNADGTDGFSAPRWNLKGTGTVKVLSDRQTANCRILHREAPTGRVILNALVQKRFRYTSTKAGVVSFQILKPNTTRDLETWDLKLRDDAVAKDLATLLTQSQANSG